MNAGRAALGAPNVQFPGLEVDIIPSQGHELAGSQAVAVGYQDGRGVPMAPAVFTGSLNQLLDLPLGKIFARPGRTLTVTFTDLGAHSNTVFSMVFPMFAVNCYNST